MTKSVYPLSEHSRKGIESLRPGGFSLACQHAVYGTDILRVRGESTGALHMNDHPRLPTLGLAAYYCIARGPIDVTSA